MMSRRLKGLLSFIGIIGLTLFINSFMVKNQEEIVFPENLYGIPTYQNSYLSYQMSSIDGDPYIAVFLSKDSYEKVLQFYKDNLKIDFKVLQYGHKKRKPLTMTIYQFEIEKGVLENYISKGVEVIPLNHRSQKVYKARTKIKIILPRKEVVDFNKKMEEKINR